MSDSVLPHRHSLRLREYDYAQAGAYFVTICTWERKCILGEVTNGAMRLSALGGIVLSCWEDVPDHRPVVELDAFVVMPNHVHGILVISDRDPAEQTGEASLAPTVRRAVRRKGTVGAIVGSFKAAVTKAANELRGEPGEQVWQRGYYEHVIRSEVALSRIREYIEVNPAKWALDHDNPANWR